MSNTYTDIEKYYEKDIIPQYGIDTKNIIWTDHGRIAEDTFAHYFSSGDEKYILVFEDFPSQSNFVAEDYKSISAPGHEYGRIRTDDPENYIENITGYFTLYEDKWYSQLRGGILLYNTAMKPDQQAILARDMIQMIEEYQDNPEVLEYLSSFAFSIARGVEDKTVVSWDDIAGTSDQRYYSIQNGDPIKLDEQLLQKSKDSIKPYLPQNFA